MTIERICNLINQLDIFNYQAAKPKRVVNILNELEVQCASAHIVISFPITYSKTIMELENDHYYDVFAQLFTTTILAVKPFLYYWLDDVMRNELKKIKEEHFKQSTSWAMMSSRIIDS